MKRRLNLLVLALEITAIALLHAVKMNDTPKTSDQSAIAHFINPFGKYNAQTTKFDLPSTKLAPLSQ